MRPIRYVLDGKTPVPADSLPPLEFTCSAYRVVAENSIHGTLVSTVFIGLDDQQEGMPRLFETTCFVAGEQFRRWRYATWDEAEAGHKRIIAALLLNALQGGRLIKP